MSSGTGIQDLMAAETRASQIVAEARIGRGDRMKQAKADAQELIDRYRAEKQVEFDKSAGTGGTSGFSSELQTETENKVSMMQAQFQENQAKAVEIMLSKCCEVDCSVPVARVRSTQKLYGQ
eukprot:CAMPEP_0116057466 /NCGR_PEP_ID=MMETSP0322-20121206/4623_1 /TAXON_ID=163516 /ORGANISM="Leptocylindrus danicus var. apora, Strain B651" /LENGTH=121 /DNA_ID=CAMNT_0003541473 /DNA_START=62 /DNA_END=427 /DNA_ORIENTATION=-